MNIVKRKIEKIKNYLNKNEIESTQNWLDIKEIKDKGIIIYSNKIIKILKVNPINYNLKSELEKEAIMLNYKKLFNGINFKFQILIKSKKQNIDKQLKELKKSTENIELRNNYINYIKDKNDNKKSSSKQFFIVIEEDDKDENISILKLQEKYLKLKELLDRNENNIRELKREEIIELFYEYLNKERN